MPPARRKRKAAQSSSNKELQSTAIAPTIAPKHDKSSESECSQSTTTEHTPTGINRLTFDCLHLVFLRLPLGTLLQIRRVSRTWNSIVIYICAHKERLTLTVYNEFSNYSWMYPRINPPVPLAKSESDLFWIDNLSGYVLDRTENVHESIHFPIKHLTKQCIVGMAQLFTGLTELRIRNDCPEILPSYFVKIDILIRLFSSASPNLRVFSLKLASIRRCFPSNTVYLEDALRNIANNITTGRLPHLKQLDLCIDGDFDSGGYLPLYSALDFQAKKYEDMLAQLERFALCYRSPSWDMKSTLAKLGSRLASLSLNITDQYYVNIASFIEMFDNVKFRTSLTHLRLSFIHDRKREASNHKIIETLCQRFQALTFVQLQIITPYPQPINYRIDFVDQWMQPLTTLQHLSELRLHDFDVALGSSLSLPRVKKLTLCKENLMVSDASAFSRTLATQFPNLEQLVIVGRPFRRYFTENAAARHVELQVRQHFAHVRSIVFDLAAPEWR